MAQNIEITENTIVRSLVRKGSDSERQQIVLAEGELGYTTDKQRLFVGDSTTTGGISVGPKFFGTVSSFSDVANQSPQPGDFFKKNNGLFARNNDGTGSPSDETGYTNLGLAATAGRGLELASGNLNVVPDNNTIEFSFDDKLKVKELPFSILPNVAAYSLLGNTTNVELPLENINIGENSVAARISDGNINSVTFDEVLTNSTDPTLSKLKLSNPEFNEAFTQPIYVNSSGQLTTSTQGLPQSPTSSLQPNYKIWLDKVNIGPLINTYATGVDQMNAKAKDDSNWTTFYLGDPDDPTSILGNVLNSMGIKLPVRNIKSAIINIYSLDLETSINYGSQPVSLLQSYGTSNLYYNSAALYRYDFPRGNYFNSTQIPPTSLRINITEGAGVNNLRLIWLLCSKDQKLEVDLMGIEF